MKDIGHCAPASKSPKCRDSELIDMVKFVRSQACLTENDNSDLESSYGVQEIEPQRIGISSIITANAAIRPVLPNTRHGSRCSADEIIELAERSRVLSSRERSRLPTYTHSLTRDELACRSKMMDWALRVIAICLLDSSTTGDRIHQHSIGSICIVDVAFCYVDHLTFKYKNLLQCRTMYKLLCMVSVHISAKMQGLFNQYPARDAQDGAPSVQTILSFRGLAALSQGQFSEKEMARMELVVLRALDWNLRSTSHDLLEWIDILVSLAEVEYGTAINDSDTMIEQIWRQVHEIVGSHYLLRFAPSKLAKAIFINTIKDHRNIDIMSMLNRIGLQVSKQEMNEIRNEMKIHPVFDLA